MSDDESRADSNEARKAMEEAEQRKKERMEQELAEYEEARRAEREKEIEELEALRIKREQRKLERQKEEERMAELREIEEKRQRAEQEERKRKKLEEEQKKKEEREKKRKEAEARMAIAKGQRNFVITKREGEGVEMAYEDLDHIHSDEPLQKSREEIEEEKRAVLAQRIQPLNLENMNSQQMAEKAKALHDKLRSLESDKYDLEQRFKRQQYDLIELAERSRQMNKGKSKRSTVQIDESFDRLSDKYTSAPPKILLCSKYERLTDRRTFGERAHLFEELSKEPPPPEIKRINPVKTDESGEAEAEDE